MITHSDNTCMVGKTNFYAVLNGKDLELIRDMIPSATWHGWNAMNGKRFDIYYDGPRAYPGYLEMDIEHAAICYLAGWVK